MKRQSAAPAFGAQAAAVANLLTSIKLVVGLFIFLLLWGARMQWNIADLGRQMTENAAATNKRLTAIEDDRRTRIERSDTWRTECDKANVRRDLLLEQLVKSAIDKPAARNR